MEAPGEPKGRFVFIDGLRGLAALGVTLFHLWGRVPGLELLLPAALADALFFVVRRLSLGVFVFFVISGFVIAHSLYGARMTRRRFGNFVLRRAIRLDPPYWAVIALTVVVTFLFNLIRAPSDALPYPSAPQLACHLLYLQEILGYGHICIVFWTLCMEVQFYLVFCLLLGAAQLLPGGALGKTAPALPVGYLIVFGPCLLAAAAWPTGIFSADLWPGLFLTTWYLFLLGVLCRWGLQSPAASWAFGLYAVLVTTAGLVTGTVAPVAGGLTAAAIAAAAYWGKLSTWLSAAWVQYLGRISYSLYLVHFVVGMAVKETGLHLSLKYLRPGPTVAAVHAVGWSVLAVVASIVTAHVFCWMIELPCVRLSKRLKHVAA